MHISGTASLEEFWDFNDLRKHGDTLKEIYEQIYLKIVKLIEDNHITDLLVSDVVSGLFEMSRNIYWKPGIVSFFPIVEINAQQTEMFGINVYKMDIADNVMVFGYTNGYIRVKIKNFEW